MTRRGRAVVRALALVFVAISVALAVAARPPTAHATAPTSAKPPLRTPLWSARRIPTLFTGAIAEARLGAAVTSAFAPFAGCVAVDDASGLLASVNAGMAFQPGSNAKLLTALAALHVRGPAFRFTTSAVTSGTVSDRTLHGDLVVVGGGDPVISTTATSPAPFTKLDDLARAIAGAGIDDITGSVAVDDSRYDNARTIADWKPNYVPDGEAGSLGALTVDRGYLPNTARAEAAADPAILTGQQLASKLESLHVAIGSGTNVTRTTASAQAHVVAHIDSAPLADIVEEMLTNSNNYTAEMLTREVGYASTHTGTTAAGTAAIVSTDGSLGVPTDSVALHDGSGLAPDDRVTCNALLAVVDRMHQPAFAPIDAGLPVAGKTGTLARRFVGDPLAGRLRAKTGSIGGAVALSGTIDSGAHPRFAFIANGNFTEAQGQALQAAVAHAVATYPAAVDPGALVPAP